MATPPRGADNPGLLLQRPFSAAGALHVAVFVHWGEHLDALAPDDLDDGLNTYVAVRASLTGRSMSTERPDDEPHQYELRSSPFATSRVIERSAFPLWNEMLLVPRPNAAWQLHVDVIRRDASQQEDALLASVALTMDVTATVQRLPQHVTVDLSSVATTQSVPRLFLSLFDVSHVSDDSGPDDQQGDVLEVLVEDMDTDSSRETRSIIVVSEAPVEASVRLHDLFTAPPVPLATVSPSDHCVWITPAASTKPVDGTGRTRAQWEFPMLFIQRHRDDGAATGVLHAAVYSVTWHGEAHAFECTGTAALALETVPLDGTPNHLSHTLSSTGESRSSRMFHTIVRRWNESAWAEFQRSSVRRRVITTNQRHRKRLELQALEWTGALCRGLNRYPISSFCDEGGLSGLLATYLGAVQESDSPLEIGQASVDAATSDGHEPQDLLNHHIHLLQQEVMMKQDTIQQLRRNADANAVALRKCGTELMAARKEVRVRDELVAQLQTKLRDLTQREADQTHELLATTGGVTGLRLDNQGTQRLNMLVFKYKELEQRHAATEAELAEAKRAAARFETLERKYADLEQAHVVQAGLVQRLQRDKAQQGELQRTIRMQEKVIQKLEKAVALHGPLQGAVQGSPEQQPRTADADSPLVAVRVQVLEQQLQSNAKAAASEISRLKMRIMELETQQNSSTGASPKCRPER